MNDLLKNREWIEILCRILIIQIFRTSTKFENNGPNSCSIFKFLTIIIFGWGGGAD